MSLADHNRKSTRKSKKDGSRELPWDFLPVPDLMWTDPKFTDSHCIVFGVICRAWALRNECAMSHVAEAAGLSKRQTIRCVNHLVDLRFVIRIGQVNSKNQQIASRLLVNVEVFRYYVETRKIEIERLVG